MMFTYNQGYELIYNTNSEWTGNYIKFKSKTNPSKYIITPVAGYYADSSIRENAGESGLYWSTKFDTSNTTYAWALYSVPNNIRLQSLFRRGGISIRPVAPPRPW